MDRYFKNLKKLGVVIDRETKKLEKIWERPHLLMNGDFTMEGSSQFTIYLDSIREIQELWIEDRKNLTKDINQTECYLTKTKDYRQNLEEQCHQIEILLSEYGYEPQLNSTEQKSVGDIEVETSILNEEQLDDSITSSLSNLQTSNNGI